jgi:dUTP pyrophosphatase
MTKGAGMGDEIAMVRVKLDEGAYPPHRAHREDAGADVLTPIPFAVPARGSYVLHTGVHIETPEGYATLIKSKSGLNIRHGIVSEGVIDEGFTGEVVVRLYNHSDHPYHFDAGDKVTQFVIVKVARPSFQVVDAISGGNRGDGGYGSTGR